MPRNCYKGKLYFVLYLRTNETYMRDKLVQAIEEYTRLETDAEMLTLLVDDTNEGATRVYQNLGFKGESIATMTASQKYGLFTYGRSIMMKSLAT